MKKTVVGSCILVGCLAAPPAFGYEAGDLLVRAGLHSVDPKSDNGDIVEVGDGTRPTLDVTYMFSRNWGVELLAAVPFEHDVRLADGGDKVATVKHLPPTVSLLYHFLPDAPVKPYLGLGLNVTFFFDEDTRGALEGADLELDTSIGPAAVAGVDIELGSRWFLNANVRYLDIDTDAELDGTKLENVEIDPFAFGVSVGYRF